MFFRMTVMREKTDDELAAMTAEFRRRIAQGATPADLQAEAFAVAREAGERALGMRHYDVQLIGGMVLSDGRIAEMKTGEGKTLVATAPAYLHALFGKGVHVITVNDYLASRDSAWMGKLYGFLGLNTGLIIHDTKPEEKHAAYAADITYGTNNEFGFDYLRDNMCFTQERIVQRPLHYCIVDEVDSILIDEARTPLIISGPSAKPTEMYDVAARLVPRLKEDEDFTIDIKTRQVALVEEGVNKCEKALGVDNLYDPKNSTILHHVQQALRAQFAYKKDRDYVVKDGQVIIVDEFTGRLMFGRRYGEGLHQAIEAKEHVNVKRESQTFASITFQNYFRMYDILSGMTGTAKTEEGEFQSIYGFDVVEVPTNRPNIRKDHSDVIYRTEQGKFKAVVEEIKTEHAKGRPILVGTVSIEKSELLSEMLRHQGVPHQVLNAKFHEQEAQIVSQAGRKGAVTIATNMAGRGTDILLGGNAEALAEQEMAKHPDREYTEEERDALIREFKQITDAEHEEVVALGGLHIIGTERHESRRIDNQLRGRAGRQGDPGSTRFYLSMQDDLVRRFGGDSMGNLMDKFGVDDSMPLEAALVSRSIENSQKRVEERNFELRKSVLDYDDVMNQQRELIYSERRKALTEASVHESVVDMLEHTVELVIGRYSGESEFPEEWDLPELLKDMAVYLPKGMPKINDIKFLSKEEFISLFKEKVVSYFESREELMGSETMDILEHTAILQVVDA
ncbi:MAG: preprotein translocase subunit SecA, partial [Clostridia bacterium]|nr:preprotein translocase subunit SecA [Clostridia bacterium]